MSWLSRTRRRWRRAQDARDALLPLDALLARRHFGRGRAERIVEIPWVLDRLQGARRVLDIGFAHAPPEYQAALSRREIPALHGLDLAAASRAGVLGCTGDMRVLPYQGETFDVVLLISTLEHVGMDNTRYGATGEHGPEAQRQALREVARVLRPTGRALVTVPFGRYENHGWFVNYDAALWRAGVEASGLAEEEVEYFGYIGRGWKRVAPADLTEIGYREQAARGAAGLLCASLRRGDAAGAQ